MTNNTKSQTQEISLSILKKRWLKFKTMKRGYYSFILLIILYVTSFFLPLLINNRPVVMKFETEYFFPAISGYYPGSTFNQDVPGETNYRLLKKTWGESLIKWFGLNTVKNAIVLLLSLFLLIPGVFAFGVSIPLAVTLIGSWILCVALVSIVFKAAEMIFDTALFMYAETGKEPAMFTKEVISGAFVKK